MRIEALAGEITHSLGCARRMKDVCAIRRLSLVRPRAKERPSIYLTLPSQTMVLVCM